ASLPAFETPLRKSSTGTAVGAVTAVFLVVSAMPSRVASVAGELGQSRLLVEGDAGGDDVVERPVHHLIEVVGLEPGAVVGNAVLGEVVGADALRAVHGADLTLAHIRCRSRRLLLL